MSDGEGQLATVLKLEDIRLSFGGVTAIDGVSCEVHRGEIFGIIGPNGAGKTSTLNCINGFYRPQKGEIFFEGQRIARVKPDKISRLGVSRTFQNIQLYAGLTVVENLLAARHLFFKSTWVEGALYFGRSRREEMRQREIVEEIIGFLDLERWRRSAVAALPYGLRKRVDLGRALARQPRLLLLDEPMAGMNAQEKEDMARYILGFRKKSGAPVVLIEHDMGMVMSLTDRIMVLDFGRKIAEGVPDAIKRNPDVIRAYLGEEVSEAV